jgi:hypothetical protein
VEYLAQLSLPNILPDTLLQFQGVVYSHVGTPDPGIACVRYKQICYIPNPEPDVFIPYHPHGDLELPLLHAESMVCFILSVEALSISRALKL